MKTLPHGADYSQPDPPDALTLAEALREIRAGIDRAIAVLDPSAERGEGS